MKQRCAFCRTPLQLGHNIIGAQHGVLGHKGFVPLDEHILVCSEGCLRDYFHDVPAVPPRIP